MKTDILFSKNKHFLDTILLCLHYNHVLKCITSKESQPRGPGFDLSPEGMIQTNAIDKIRNPNTRLPCIIIDEKKYLLPRRYFMPFPRNNTKAQRAGRNSKQIQISKALMTKTTSTSQYRVCLLFGSFYFWSFDIVSFFGFRASDLKTFYFIRQSQ